MMGATTGPANLPYLPPQPLGLTENTPIQIGPRFACIKIRRTEGIGLNATVRSHGSMPINGEVNNKFGVYKTVCCGCEIVIAEGMEFPDCPKHPKLTTIWKPIHTDVTNFPALKPKPNSAA